MKHVCPGSSGVEQRTENPRVGSSNLPPGTILYFDEHYTKKFSATYLGIKNIGLFVCIVIKFKKNW